MRINWNLMMGFFLLGLVDNVEQGWVTAEITSQNDTGEYEVINIDLPVDIFPCEIKEGDMFYFAYVDDVTEIRCGEPPE